MFQLFNILIHIFFIINKLDLYLLLRIGSKQVYFHLSLLIRDKKVFNFIIFTIKFTVNYIYLLDFFENLHKYSLYFKNITLSLFYIAHALLQFKKSLYLHSIKDLS